MIIINFRFQTKAKMLLLKTKKNQQQVKKHCNKHLKINKNKQNWVQNITKIKTQTT